MRDKFNYIKQLYEDGYRCIYYDCNEDDVFTIYLKNFDNEKSETVQICDCTEFNQFKSYIDGLSQNSLF
ncbi:hypothetical protein JWYL7_0011 [Alkalithermobacter thermoalcaliphilus JW-YL-7 = DSM 7308]|uniref:Uncharacterized protein n=1 Tax=Alkalithermobacter thermoalcaliphilus JW-YL-7 = DSM 7308 TaxID=1121328 RepID=A0A150FN04_CLOPD|nr:hypothetical protein JWYL7_0011 [[Clostridium] paradoxum JW-YL-7 = DSM 7308]